MASKKRRFNVLGVGLFVVALAVIVSNIGQSPTTGDVDVSRCLQVPHVLLDSIQDSLVNVEANIAESSAVLSEDFSSVYFVAFKLVGADGDEEIGVWTTNDLGNDGTHGIIMSVNAEAKAVSPFPDASRSNAEITMADDGAREAERCVN